MSQEALISSEMTTGQDLAELTTLLKSALLDAIRLHSSAQADTVEQIIRLSKDAHQDGQQHSMQPLAARIDRLSPQEVAAVAAAFTAMLTLENLAEDVSSKLRAEDAAREGLDALVGSTTGTVQALLRGGDFPGGGEWGKPCSPKAVSAALEQIQLDLVFTAHPTQVMRRTLVRRCQAMRALLLQLHRKALVPLDREDCLQQLRMLIHLCWRTDEVRRKPLTPVEEMRSNLSYVQESIFPAVPVFLRRLNKMLVEAGLSEYPLSKSPFKFSAWAGGDRDGNPNVTASITRKVVLTTRIEAVTLYIEKVQELMWQLSMWRATPEFLSYVERSEQRFFRKFGNSQAISDMRCARGYTAFYEELPETEPYRLILAEVRDRLWDTRAALNSWQSKGGRMPSSLQQRLPLHEGSLAALEYEGPFTCKHQVLESLLAIRDSLVACGDALIADGHLTDLIRQITVFGLAFTPFDIRQESSRHTDAMDAITQFLGLGSYAAWNEQEKVTFLARELGCKRPLLPASFLAEVRGERSTETSSESKPILTDDVREVLATFATLSELPLDSFGTYIISMAEAASDVLCVRLLQKEFGVSNPMLRVAPLFETLSDLKNAPTSMRTLFSCEQYRQHHVIGRIQEVMIGYSDSGKDAGRLAAAWAQYETQEKLVEVAKEFEVELIFFHGRGGTVGRGGGPVQLAVRSQPAGTIQKGRMRVTVQGEVIERQFGDMATACSTIDTYIGAMLEAELREPAPVKSDWRALMRELQQKSCDAYREIVFGNPCFFAYFRDVTPSAELEQINIGSRPAKRRKVESVAAIRAIPWIFAWTQTRFNLPVWLGVGKAIAVARDSPDQWAILQDMYHNFIFFRVFVDLLEMVFAKSDPDIAMLYDAELATSEESRAMGSMLKMSFLETQTLILTLAGHDDLLHGLPQHLNLPDRCKARWMEFDAQLKKRIHLRSIFITPLNLLQVRCLRATRSAAKAGLASAPVQSAASMATRTDLGLMEDSLLLTVKGIAAGLQNTG
eukprot:TRINITY_DN11318_c0_g1_i1.p1 TRINITY_DN11318_c0_g1~~TRINITY_DN11318_c0_g1_i1.p1  ORF type:complete len:1012 (-),score=202.39 TRINITY_DN11318_c0_g1_i1:65-3100(-)